MSDIDVTAYAPDRATGVAFMLAVGIAAEVGGKIQPIVNAHISTTDDGWSVGTWSGEGEAATFTARPGWFCNVRYYGATAEALLQGGDQESPDLFARAPGLLAITEARIGDPMTWVALTNDPVPPGYQNSDGVRLYDPALIATRSNVWA